MDVSPAEATNNECGRATPAQSTMNENNAEDNRRREEGSLEKIQDIVTKIVRLKVT